MNIAIITARGGSKRIPRKNIRPFLGKPMIAWPIEAARKSGCFERILVSTDDEEIADIARAHGAEVPFFRPAHLADDFTPVGKAVRHALEWALQNWGAIEAFCHIYPTAPFLTPQVLRQSMDALASGLYKAAFAMLKLPFPVYQIMIMAKGNALERLFPEDKALMRSQDMPSAYIDVGQSYAFDTAHYLQHGPPTGTKLLPVEIALEAALDIDTEEDWKRAETIVSRLKPGATMVL